MISSHGMGAFIGEKDLVAFNTKSDLKLDVLARRLK